MLPHSIESSAPFATQGPQFRVEPKQVSRFALDWASVAWSAFLASTAITLYMMFVPRWLGIEPMDIGITVGQIAAPGTELPALLARLSWHMGNGLVYVVACAMILLRLRLQSSARTGVVFGIILWLAGPMLLIPTLLNLHPAVASGSLTNPGIFMLDLGLGWMPAITDLGAHLIHGVTTGVVYKHRQG